MVDTVGCEFVEEFATPGWQISPSSHSRQYEVPENAPETCPACDADHDSVSAHTDAVMVNLVDNERYRRVCFDPDASEEEGRLYFYHHTHEQTYPGPIRYARNRRYPWNSAVSR